MTDAQLAKLNHKQLVELQNKINVAIAARRDSERAELKAKIMALASESGFDVGELMGTTRKGKLAGSKIAPKYVNPNDPSQTWTGRGRKPLWMVAEIKRGKKLESFAI